jgi:hypothetical protein
MPLFISVTVISQNYFEPGDCSSGFCAGNEFSFQMKPGGRPGISKATFVRRLFFWSWPGFVCNVGHAPGEHLMARA